MPDNASQKASIGQQIFRFIISRGKTIIVITEALVLLVFLSRFKLDRDVNDYAEQIENKNAIVSSTKTIENEFKRIQIKTETVKKLVNNQIDWSEQMDDFDSKVAAGMRLENIVYNEGEISLHARTNSAESFASFISNMINDETVEEVILESSNFDPSAKVYSFSVHIKKRVS